MAGCPPFEKICDFALLILLMHIYSYKIRNFLGKEKVLFRIEFFIINPVQHLIIPLYYFVSDRLDLIFEMNPSKTNGNTILRTISKAPRT